MVLAETCVEGVFVLEPEKARDERGYFARMWSADEFEHAGLCSAWVQSSVSFNTRRGTLRGMHYQVEPHREVKLVSCTAGAVFDVVIDLRADSPSYRRWFGVELTADNRCTLYVPEGLAHGFITLVDDSVVEYHMSEYYHPDAARGVRWSDPAFAIQWPAEPAIINERDASYADFMDAS
ncbi:MAG: dTDP-4-dehydrorhamnose 3,5-epimerase [Coriobacteriia bacterium]|nr:dTDP-4-dehydrorhamnose 3,5-epimerase [Coriobacteriia bacterium]